MREHTTTSAAVAAPARPARPDRVALDSLTGMRFVAALLVVLHHGTMYLPLPVATPVAALGYVGVTFFFVLSGFVLCWSASPGVAKRHFYGRRFARIYPTYLVTTVIAVVLCLALGRPTGLGPVASALTVTQAWFSDPAYTERLNVVSWSISDEAFFYALLPFVLLGIAGLVARRLVRMLAVIVAAMLLMAALVHALLSPGTADDLLYKLPVFRLGEFLIGVVLARLMRAGWRCPVRVRTAALVAAAVYLLLVAGLDQTGHLAVVRFLPDLIMLGPLALLIAAAATADLAGDGGMHWLRARPTVHLGQASFQLYMTHYLWLIALGGTLAKVSGRPAQGAALLGFTVVAVVTSVVGFRYLERPMERRLRARLGGAATVRAD